MCYTTSRTVVYHYQNTYSITHVLQLFVGLFVYLAFNYIKMIEQTIQKQINLINNGIKGFTLTLHKDKGKGKLMIIDEYTNLYTSLMIDKMSVIQKGLGNVILHSQNEGYNIDNLLLYLKK